MYHLNKKGIPEECKDNSSCKQNEHFGSLKEAEEYSYERNYMEFGLIFGLGKKDTPCKNPYCIDYFENLKGKRKIKDEKIEGYDVCLYQEEEIISGLLLEERKNSFLISSYGGIIEIDKKDIREIVSSKDYYNSQEHKNLLLECHVPKHNLRINRKALESIKGKYVYIKTTEGETHIGEIVSFSRTSEPSLSVESISGYNDVIFVYEIDGMVVIGESKENSILYSIAIDLCREAKKIKISKFSPFVKNPDEVIYSNLVLLSKNEETRDVDFEEELINKKNEIEENDLFDFEKEVEKTKLSSVYYDKKMLAIKEIISRIDEYDFSSFSLGQEKSKREIIFIIFKNRMLNQEP